MNGTNLIGVKPPVPVANVVEAIMGAGNYVLSSYNDANTALNSTYAFSSAVLGALLPSLAPQDGLGKVMSDVNNTNTRCFLEHVSANYGRSDFAYALERAFSMAKFTNDSGEVSHSVLLLPIFDKYSVAPADFHAGVSGSIANAGTVALSYSGFSSAQLTATCVSETNPTLAFSTQPKVVVQKFTLNVPNQTVWVVGIGSKVLEEMAYSYLSDFHNNVAAVNNSAFAPSIYTGSSPLEAALNQVLGNMNKRVIYIQNPVASVVGSHGLMSNGPLSWWQSGTVDAVQFCATLMLPTASAHSVFVPIVSTSKSVSLLPFFLYPVVQAMLFEKIMVKQSSWISRFFPQVAGQSDLGKIVYKVYNMASSYGNNQSQKSFFSENTKAIVDAAKPHFTKVNAAPGTARAAVTAVVQSIGGNNIGLSI